MEISKNYVLVFDEFQDVYEKDPALANKIRSAIQFFDRSVIMLGSKRHLLQHMFLNPRGIFYNFGYAMHLEKIRPEQYKKFIADWFERTGTHMGSNDAEDVLVITGAHPFFTQCFCHFLFNARQSRKTQVQQILGEIVESNAPFYEQTYTALPATQKKTLVLLASDPEKMYSTAALKHAGLSNSQTLQKALGLLFKKEIIDKNGKYHILDVFFQHWIKRKNTRQTIVP